MKILLTGFEPFGGESINPAKEAVKLVKDEIKGAQIVKCYVPVVFGKAIDTVYEAMKKENPDAVFKTLVTQGKTKNYYVFFISVEKELDLKKAAKAVGEKSIEMLPLKELLPLTGYVHGGCSPIGMKKFFTTTFDESLNKLDKVYFSGGKVGFQVEVAVKDIEKVIGYNTAEVTV